jgi:cell wall-associated NlpC family hydrolase
MDAPHPNDKQPCRRPLPQGGEGEERARVCAIARSWIDTPYHDCAELKGVGVDCAKLIAMTFFEAGFIDRLMIPDYPPTWFVHRDEERFLSWVQQFAREIPEAAAQPGDVVLYKFAKCYAHGAIVIEPGWPAIVHAWFAARKVLRADGLRDVRSKPNQLRKFFTRW